MASFSGFNVAPIRAPSKIHGQVSCGIVYERGYKGGVEAPVTPDGPVVPDGGDVLGG